MTVKEFFEEYVLFKPDKVVFFDLKENVQDSIQSDEIQWFIEEYGNRRINNFRFLRYSRIDIEIE